MNWNQVKNRIEVIAFDADDTLWDNEIYFREAEHHLFTLLQQYAEAEVSEEALLKTEKRNLKIYGYGIKGFTLSMIETAIHISQGKISSDDIFKIIKIGQSMYQKPVSLLENVASVLDRLKARYRLIVATKGDLLDQKRKLKLSGLTSQFHHIEIMTEKKTNNYRHLIERLEIEPSQFLMIGNSLKSDILPVIEIGGNAIHIPYHTTWSFEQVDLSPVNKERFLSLNAISELENYLLESPSV